jgi:hypothetical protein
MNRFACLSLFAIAALVAGCADPNTVLFVTNTSLGINFDSKPPTANIAYDRTEGFVGPRFPNGGTPPAVASIESGGNIFEPKVRQVYATGHAAVRATKGPDTDEGPKNLEGDATKKKLMFFGTETTLGVKVGFGTNALPDSVLFGYRRKEASVIPLGENTENGKTTAVYPSVLASIDMNTKTTSPTETGITSKQFFATGQAAVALATNPAVGAAFAAKAESAALASLSEDERKAVILKVDERFKTADEQFKEIASCVGTPDGGIDKAKLAKAVTDANTKGGNLLATDVANQTTVEGLRRRLGPPRFVSHLYMGLPRNPATGAVQCQAS